MALRVVIGDEVGQLKVVGVGSGWGAVGSVAKAFKQGDANGRTVSRLASSSRETAVERCSWVDENDFRKGVVWATKNGLVKYVRDGGPDTSEKREVQVMGEGHGVVETFDQFTMDDGCKGLEVWDGKAFVCSGKGVLQTCAFNPEKRSGEAFGEFVGSFQTGQKVSRMRRSPTSGLFATGGEQHDLSLWDVNSEKRVFFAKNVPHDFLDLEVPIWVTDMCFLPFSDGVVDETEAPKKKKQKPALSLSGGVPDRIATCTAYSQVRIYDTRAKRRPVQDGYFPDAAELCGNTASATSKHLNCITALDTNTVAVGSAAGNLFSVDLRTMRLLHRYKSVAGSIRTLRKHPSLPLLASAGLDRYVRVHNTVGRELEACVYVKQRLVGDILFAGEAQDKFRGAEIKKATKAEEEAEDVVEELSFLNDEDEDDEKLLRGGEEETKAPRRKNNSKSKSGSKRSRR